jgi:hypothetical protein
MVWRVRIIFVPLQVPEKTDITLRDGSYGEFNVAGNNDTYLSSCQVPDMFYPI